MQIASAGHRESPWTPTNLTLTLVPDTLVLSPGESTKFSFSRAVGEAGLQAAQTARAIAISACRIITTIIRTPRRRTHQSGARCAAAPNVSAAHLEQAAASPRR